VGNDSTPPHPRASRPAGDTATPDDPPRTEAPSRLSIAARSLVRVMRNRDIRALELSWTVGVAVDWAILVVALVVAYDAGGAVAVGLVSLTRMLPAMVVNTVVDATRAGRPERVLVAVNLIRGASAGVIAAAIMVDQPLLAFVAVAVGAAAGALVRPTTLALLPSVAVRPEDLVSANTAGALGESIGTFAGPLITGLVVAASGPAYAAAIAAAGGVIAAAIVVRVSVAEAARPPVSTRSRGLPLLAGIRELVRRRPAGVLMLSFGVQVTVRGALTTFIAILAIEVLGMGDAGVGILGAAIGAGGVVGALFAVAFGTGGRLAGMFAAALVAWGAPFVLIGVAPSPGLALLALAITGVGNALLDVSGLTLLQRGVSTAARGGVFAVLEVMASIGVSVGALIGSFLVTTIGVERALVITGLALPLTALLGWRWVRRLDDEGVLPDRQARLLRGIPLFAPLPLAALERIADGMQEVHYAPGEALMTQGEEGDTYVMVESGRVMVTIDGRVDHEQGPGDGVGEIALLRSVPRTATVTAVEPVQGFQIDCHTFVEAVTGHEDSRRAASDVVAARLGATDAPA
jgi:MFS family permease